MKKVLEYLLVGFIAIALFIGAKQVAIFPAVAFGNTAFTYFLLDNGSSANAKWFGDKTLLMTSMENCDVETASLLIFNGARIGDRDKNGKNAMDYLSEEKCVQGIGVFIEEVGKSVQRMAKS